MFPFLNGLGVLGYCRRARKEPVNSSLHWPVGELFSFLQRDELLDAEESAENKITNLEQRGHELQAYIQQMSVDLQNVSWEKHVFLPPVFILPCWQRTLPQATVPLMSTHLVACLGLLPRNLWGSIIAGLFTSVEFIVVQKNQQLMNDPRAVSNKEWVEGCVCVGGDCHPRMRNIPPPPASLLTQPWLDK